MCPKYKTEALKNMVANRFQLNFKRNVGPTSESIRQCQPGSPEEWEEYYYENVRSPDHITCLGERMFAKIRDDIIPALESITEEECIRYMHGLVIQKTYQGYIDEIQTVRDILQRELQDANLLPAPDEWDRTLAVDYYIDAGAGCIGLQIKPLTLHQIPNLHEWQRIWEVGHAKFEREYGGKVFTLIHVRKADGSKELHNPQVIEEIKSEIDRLQRAQPSP